MQLRTHLVYLGVLHALLYHLHELLQCDLHLDATRPGIAQLYVMLVRRIVSRERRFSQQQIRDVFIDGPRIEAAHKDVGFLCEDLFPEAL